MCLKCPARTTTLFASAMLIAFALGFSTPALAQSCGPGETARFFAFTGGDQSTIIPQGVRSATVHLSGAQGGDGIDGAGFVGGAGGRGGRVSGTLAVSPGDVLSIGVGGRGSLAVNPGGAGGSNQDTPVIGGNGGGATDIRLGGSRIAVAGGGGGGGNAGWGGGSPVHGGDGGASGGSGAAGSDTVGASQGNGPNGGGGGGVGIGGAGGIGCGTYPAVAGEASGTGGSSRNFAGSFPGAGNGGGGGGGAVVGGGGGGGGVGTSVCTLNWNGAGGGGGGGTSDSGLLQSAIVTEGVNSGDGTALVCLATPQFMVSGTAFGQTGTVSLRLETTIPPSIQTISVAADDASFSFADGLADGVDWSVEVITSPDGQACTVEPSTGTVSGDDVNNLALTCATAMQLQDHVLNVMTGTSGTVDLTRGATGGPFSAAAIASHPASEAGHAWIVREGDAYILHFAAAGTFAGTTTLTYTLSNAHGTPEPGTVTINVIDRPDPSRDPEVVGLIRAQTETAKRFANTQIRNFSQRLEQLHNEDERRSSSMSVNFGVQASSIDPSAYSSQEDTPHDSARDAISRVSSNPTNSGLDAEPAPAENLFRDLAVWSGGYVNFGATDDGAIKLDNTLVGVSAGIDYRITPQITAGIGIGYGRDVTQVGSNGTESRAEAFSLVAYGSYRPVPHFFIDGLAGYSTMSFDSLRHVTWTGDRASGNRSGDQLFAALSAGYEHRQGRLLISPYGRLSGSHSTLHAFTETGAGIYNLSYGKQRIGTFSGTLGLRLEYAIPSQWGVVTPRARLEYTRDFEGSSRASIGYADLGSLPYALDVEAFSRDHLSISLGLDAQIGKSWNLGFDYRTALGTKAASQEHAFGARLSAQF